MKRNYGNFLIFLSTTEEKKQIKTEQAIKQLPKCLKLVPSFDDKAKNPLNFKINTQINWNAWLFNLMKQSINEQKNIKEHRKKHFNRKLTTNYNEEYPISL